MALNIYAALPGKNGTATPRQPVLPAPVGAPATIPEALDIVALDDILLQEDADAARADPLVQALERDGVQRHPVILARTPEGSLPQIDGANRVTALRRLGCRHVVAQIVDYADPDAIHLSTWMHLTCLPPLASLHDTAVWDALAVEPVAPAQAVTMLAQERAVAVLIGADQEVVAVRSGLGLLTRVAVLRQLVAAYAIPAVRVPVPEAASLVASARAELAVNVPLALLQADLPATEKTARLQARLAGQCYRVYAEPTLVYEAE